MEQARAVSEEMTKELPWRALRNPEAFALVKIDAEAQTLVWPNGADFDPAILHDWPQHEAAMRELAKRWAMAGV